MLSTDKIKKLKKIIVFLVFIVLAATAVNLFAAPGSDVPPGLKDKIEGAAKAKLATQNAVAREKATHSGMLYLAAALCVGFSSFAAGWAVSTVGAAAMGAISEKPELAGRALIFVGLAEGIAIYGLIVAIMLLGKA